MTVAMVVRRVGVNLLVACVMPAVLFYVCFTSAGMAVAMGVALTWVYGGLLVRHLSGRSVSGMLVLSTVVLTARTLVALCSGSTFLYFLQPAITDLVVGGLFLGSLLVGRPVVARLASDFYPMDEQVGARAPIRLLFARLTGMWAAVMLGKAVLTLWLLTSLSVDDFVSVMSMLGPSVSVLTAVVTVATATRVGRREGLIGHPAALAVPVLAAA